MRQNNLEERIRYFASLLGHYINDFEAMLEAGQDELNSGYITAIKKKIEILENILEKFESLFPDIFEGEE